MATNVNTYTVKKGDNLWAVATNYCKQSGKSTPTNADIIAAMNKLASYNGFDNYKDFQKEYFNKIGSTFKISDEETKTEKSSKPKVDTKQQLVDEINKMKSSKDRVIEYNKLFGKKHYAIVDKKACTITLYDKDGNIVKDINGHDMVFPVGVGKYRGDNLMFGYATPSNDPMHEKGRYTAAGEFTLDELDDRVRSEGSFENYGSRVMDLKGDNRGEHSAQMAFHQVPERIDNSERTRALRSDKNPDGTLKAKRNTADNRMSYGCVNLLPEDYDALYEFLNEGSKVYILPEEKGNELRCEKQKDGTMKFVQAYHKDQVRDMSAEEASEVCYDKNTSQATSFKGWSKGLAYSAYNKLHKWFS